MNRRHGFTLIELITALAIVGILATIGLPMLRRAIDKAKAAAVVELIHQARVAYEAAPAQISTAAMNSRPGEVPPGLAPQLPSGAFRTPDGLLLWGSLAGRNGRYQYFLYVRAGSDEARPVFEALGHQLPRGSATISPSLIVVPMNQEARASLGFH